MRLRLLRRRLTISAPRMAVRSAMPWPLRWAVVAIVLGFCAAIGLWAFEFGKDIAGVDGGRVEELRAEIATLNHLLAQTRDERDKAQSVANTSNTILTAAQAVQEKLQAQVKQLEAENRSLRDDLGFFEQLIPSVAGENLSIRGFHAELQDGHGLKWQILVIQPLKNAAEFNGRLELVFTGVREGRPWTATLPGGPQSLKFRQYGRAEGLLELPPQTVVKSVAAKVMEGNAVKATQSIKL